MTKKIKVLANVALFIASVAVITLVFAAISASNSTAPVDAGNRDEILENVVTESSSTQAPSTTQPSTTAEPETDKKEEEKSSLPAIDPDKPVIALSFDDGPAFTYENENTTDQILDILEKNGARATFFMCGSRVNSTNAYCLKRELELGCEIGNHTYDHKKYGDDVKADDIKKSSDRIKEYSGSYPTIFRCPGGLITDKIRTECKKEKMPIAYWSIDTEDWKSQDPDKIYKAVMKNAYDGSIILMHDIYPTTVEAVSTIVPKLIEQGYQIVTVSEMLTIKNDGKPPKAGEQYVDYKTINNNT